MSQLETRKTWSTGELKNISMYYIFPVLNASRHCFSSPIFFIMIIERGFADLGIESSFNIQTSVSPSSQLWEALWSQISSSCDQELENITRDFDQRRWWWWWKWITAQKIVIPLAFCQPCHVKLFFFVFLPRLSLNSWSQVHFKTSFFLGPRGPLVLPLVDPRTRAPARNENLDPMYTGIYASWIIRRLIKPTRWPNGIP